MNRTNEITAGVLSRRCTDEYLRRYALMCISGRPDNFHGSDLSVSYTDFKKIKTLTEGEKFYEITYGTDGQRRKSVYTVNNVFPVPESNTVIRYYIGDYEEKIAGGITEKIHYLCGAVYIEKSDGTSDFYYTYADYLVAP